MRFKCPQCGRVLKADDAMAGRRFKCPGCGHAVVVPSSAGDSLVAQSESTRQSKPTSGSDQKPVSGVCDICNLPTGTNQGGKVFSPKQIRLATSHGFNGMGFGQNAELLAMAGVQAAETYPEWVRKVEADSTDWLLCQCCQAEIGKFDEQAATPGHVEPERGNPAHIAKVREFLALQREHDKKFAGEVTLRGAFQKHNEHMEMRDAWRQWRASLTVPLNLNGADFSRRSFTGFDFHHATMVGVKLRRAACYWINCQSADLRGADFSEAVVHNGFHVKGANLANADFTNAVLTGPEADASTNFTGANFTGCKLKKNCDDESGGEKVRAFRQLLSKEQQKQLAGGCFVATAACGDEDATEVRILRGFRDQFLMHSKVGRFMVEKYYRLSPPLAEIIAGNRFLRYLVRNAVISPVAFVLRQVFPIQAIGRKAT